MTDPSDAIDVEALPEAVTALADRLESILADLDDALRAKRQLFDALWQAMADRGGDVDDIDRAVDDTGMRRLIGLCLEAHALLRPWCLPDRAELSRGNDY